MTIIYGIPGCIRCRQAIEHYVDAKYVELTLDEATTVGRILNLRTMPIIVTTED